MPHVAQELHNELHRIGSTRSKFLFLNLFLSLEKTESNDVFRETFIRLDSSLTEIPVELQSTMSIVFHLRNTFHSILQSRRAILHNIVLHLSDRAKEQVTKFSSLFFRIEFRLSAVRTSRKSSSSTSVRKFQFDSRRKLRSTFGFQTIRIDHWTPLEELLQCSRLEKRSLTDLDNSFIEENLHSVDLPLIGEEKLGERKEKRSARLV